MILPPPTNPDPQTHDHRQGERRHYHARRSTMIPNPNDHRQADRRQQRVLRHSDTQPKKNPNDPRQADRRSARLRRRPVKEYPDRRDGRRRSHGVYSILVFTDALPRYLIPGSILLDAHTEAAALTEARTHPRIPDEARWYALYCNGVLARPHWSRPASR